jgi:hypothetical protein
MAIAVTADVIDQYDRCGNCQMKRRLRSTVHDGWARLDPNHLTLRVTLISLSLLQSVDNGVITAIRLPNGRSVFAARRAVPPCPHAGKSHAREEQQSRIGDRTVVVLLRSWRGGRIVTGQWRAFPRHRGAAWAGSA